MKRSLSTLCLLLVFASGSFAQDADMQAMMEAWEKASSPSEHHELLQPFAGNFSVTGKFRMEPDGEWSTGSSTADSKWVMDGRFVMQQLKGEMMPMSDRPFEGLGLIGYDNAAGEYVSVWIDNHSTTTYQSQGKADASGKVISFSGNYADPMTQEKRNFRWVYKVGEAGGYVMEMYEHAPDGTEFLSGELTYMPRSS